MLSNPKGHLFERGGGRAPWLGRLDTAVGTQDSTDPIRGSETGPEIEGGCAGAFDEGGELSMVLQEPAIPPMSLQELKTRPTPADQLRCESYV